MFSLIKTHFALSLFLVEMGAIGQQPKVLAPHRPIASRVAASKQHAMPPAKPGSLVGGLWVTDANYKSQIYLRNVVETSAVTATPILYLSNGVRYALDPVTIAPSGTKVVDVNAALQSKGVAPFATLHGYVEIDYNWPWNPLCATVRDVDTTHSLIFTYGAGHTRHGRFWSPTTEKYNATRRRTARPNDQAYKTRCLSNPSWRELKSSRLKRAVA